MPLFSPIHQYYTPYPKATGRMVLLMKMLHGHIFKTTGCMYLSDNILTLHNSCKTNWMNSTLMKIIHGRVYLDPKLPNKWNRYFTDN